MPAQDYSGNFSISIGAARIIVCVKNSAILDLAIVSSQQYGLHGEMVFE